MRLAILLLLFWIALGAGCSEESPQPTNLRDDVTARRQADPPPVPAQTESSPQAPAGPEQKFEGQTAQDAANVVRRYYELIADGRYDDAWQLRWHEGSDAPPEFGRAFADYADLKVTVGTPSRVQGAAGSLFVEVPVQLFGRRKNGAPFSSAGTITLRRSNNIPEATPAQLRWRISAND